MKPAKRILFSLLLTLSLFAFPCHGEDRVYIDITSAEARKINFAVPWFQNIQSRGVVNDYGKSLADSLAKSLKFHGIINIIPTASYNGSQNGDWRQLLADFTVLGLYSSSSNSLDLELRLFDVTNDKMLLGKSYKGKLDQSQDMLYRFCDSVIKELTGKEGLSSSQIAFISQDNNRRKELYLTDILGRTVRQVTRHHNLVVSPRFVPDSPFMTYTSYHTGNQNLYITDLRQNKVTRALSRRPGMNLAPAWSPDGESMIITLSYKGNPDLYLLNRNGQIKRQLTSNTGISVSPTYSPDGKNIVFVSDRSGSPQLYLMELSSRKVQRLTFEGSENAEPDYHPSENLVVFSSLRNGSYQICTIEPKAGATATQLTSALTNHEAPSWSPDGNQIVFSKQEGRVNRIYAMMKNGSFQRMLFSFPGSQTSPRWTSKR